MRDRWGSGRGLARLLLSQGGRLLGRYRRFERIDWSRVERLVFVCSGNICRSPYAERRVAETGYPSISLALRGDAGRPADPAARAAAKRVGIELGEHRAATVDGAALFRGDLLVAMEPWQARMLRRAFRRTKSPCSGSGPIRAGRICTIPTPCPTPISRPASG
jgi:protein-tyrosine phosphatase